MDKKFSGCEIVDLAVEIEKNGKDFYQELSSMTDNEDVKESFKELADQENKHIDIFKGLHDEECEYEPEGAYPDEYFAYMNALAGEYIFAQKQKGTEIAKGVKDYKEGIEVGIRFEKDSILFYEMMKDLVPDDDKKVIDDIIAEERKHLVKLCELKGGCTD